VLGELSEYMVQAARVVVTDDPDGGGFARRSTTARARIQRHAVPVYNAGAFAVLPPGGSTTAIIPPERSGLRDRWRRTR
jgi:hypothetical protein